MRRLALAAAAVLGLLLAHPTPAAASTWYDSCSIGGYNFDGSITVSSGLWNSYRISYHTGTPIGLEWRARSYTSQGSVTWDSGYQTDPAPNSVAGYPGASTSGVSGILLNAGRLGDGYPTCEMWFTL